MYVFPISTFYILNTHNGMCSCTLVKLEREKSPLNGGIIRGAQVTDWLSGQLLNSAGVVGSGPVLGSMLDMVSTLKKIIQGLNS